MRMTMEMTSCGVSDLLTTGSLSGMGFSGTSSLLNVEPRRNPHVFNVEEQPQEHLDRQSDHGQEKRHQDRVLQQAHALVVFGVVAAEEGVHQQADGHKEGTDYTTAEDAFAPGRRESEKIGEV